LARLVRGGEGEQLFAAGLHGEFDIEVLHREVVDDGVAVLEGDADFAAGGGGEGFGGETEVLHGDGSGTGAFGLGEGGLAGEGDDTGDRGDGHDSREGDAATNG